MNYQYTINLFINLVIIFNNFKEKIMRCKLLTLSLFIVIFNLYSNTELKNNFKCVIITNGFIDNQVQVNYYNNISSKNFISFLRYTRVPLSNKYVIHSLYTAPKYRNKGIAKKLILYTINLLKDKKAKAIYIQPGPFEIINKQSTNIIEPNERKYRVEKLIKLYKSIGFKPVSKMMSKLSTVLYKILGIQEDANCLMVLTI